MAVEIVPCVRPISRFTVSEEDDEKNAVIPAIIATTTMPSITPFLFIAHERRNWLKKLIPNYGKIFL